MIGACGAALMAQTPVGKMVINGSEIPFTNVYACMCPDPFDKKKSVLTLVATDRPVPPEVRTSEDAIRDLVWDKKLYAFEMRIDGDNVGWNVRPPGGGGNISSSRSPNPFKLTITATTVKGQVKLPEPSKLGDTTYSFDFAVDATIEKPVVEAPPSPADRAAAAKSPAAQAYIAFQKVLMTGTVAQIAEMVDPEKAEMMRKEPRANEMLAFIRKMQPKNIAVLKATETGDDAVLIASGTEEGKPQTGKIQMKKMAGKWIIMKESWQGKM